MRDLNWRRFHLERVLKKRTINFSKHWHYFYNENGDRIINPMWIDFIGSKDFYFYRNNSTDPNDSNYKIKYSPNKGRGYRDVKPNKRNSFNLREKDNQLVRKIIKEYYESI